MPICGSSAPSATNGGRFLKRSMMKQSPHLMKHPGFAHGIMRGREPLVTTQRTRISSIEFVRICTFGLWAVVFDMIHPHIETICGTRRETLLNGHEVLCCKPQQNGVLFLNCLKVVSLVQIFWDEEMAKLVDAGKYEWHCKLDHFWHQCYVCKHWRKRFLIRRWIICQIFG